MRSFKHHIRIDEKLLKELEASDKTKNLSELISEAIEEYIYIYIYIRIETILNVLCKRYINW